ncbi:MAG: hypothetical protein GXX96_23570 [Planctomycetaceae bacterium]|nr:hypothetical protein [Planctomycetaceae bacterium]
MNKIYLLAHATRRFQSDFCYAGTHALNPPCDACGQNTNELRPPLLYYWDEEFGTPELSMSHGHTCFWGGLWLMVTGHGKALLDRVGLPFEFADTKPVRTKLVRKKLMVESLPAPENALFWARPTNIVDADPRQSNNEVCHKCGKFTKQVRQLTRLKIPRSDATSQGIFTVRQNHDAPIFVTDETKSLLIQSDLKGIGFYPAGMII